MGAAKKDAQNLGPAASVLEEARRAAAGRKGAQNFGRAAAASGRAKKTVPKTSSVRRRPR